MRLGICVCECVSVHARLCPRGHVYVCTCMFAGVCVGHRTHFSQTRSYLLPSENLGEEGSCPGVLSSCV